MSWFSQWFNKKTGAPEINLGRVVPGLVDAIEQGVASSVLRPLWTGDLRKLHAAIEAELDRRGEII